jgi:uroporphyrin-III C-methyltransferase/precorrin-2 dehydrogenase/sirohydrochlorin ferrochelatase
VRFLPLFHDLSDGTVALIGAGPAAQIKLRLLRAAGAKVRWYAGNTDIAEELLVIGAPPGRVEVDFSDPLEADFSQFTAVIAATGSALDEAIAARAQAANTLVNVVDRADLSNVGAAHSRAHRGAAAGTHR